MHLILNLARPPLIKSVNGAKSEGGVQVPFLCLGNASSLRQSDCFVESLVGGSTSLGISEAGTGGILASVKSGAQSMWEILHARFANNGSNAIYEICLYYGR